MLCQPVLKVSLSRKFCWSFHLLRVARRILPWLNMALSRLSVALKGQSHGQTAKFRGLKCPKISKNLQNNYTALISTKNTTIFVLTTLPYGHFFLISILVSIKINKSAIKPYFLHRSAISTVSAFLLKISTIFFKRNALRTVRCRERYYWSIILIKENVVKDT